MAAINFSALNGQGYLYSFDLPILEHTWVITTPTSYGSAYLTFEAVRLPNGFYDDTSSTPGLATFSDFVGLNIDTLVTSSNKFSVVIPQGGGTFKWVNTNIIPANTMFIRGTGGITITSSSTSYIFTSKAELQTAVNLWISDNTAALATYGEINTWNVSAVTDMASLFSIKTTFNSDISNWDMSNAVTIGGMFMNATSFNQPLNNSADLNILLILVTLLTSQFEISLLNVVLLANKLLISNIAAVSQVLIPPYVTRAAALSEIHRLTAVCSSAVVVNEYIDGERFKVIPPVALKNEELTAILAVGVKVYEPTPFGTTTEDTYEEVTKEFSLILLNPEYKPKAFVGIKFVAPTVKTASESALEKAAACKSF